MATYIIGDIHGCFGTLSKLLSSIGFSSGKDTLHLVGDLVNGGRDSLRVLKWAKKNSDSVETVLGNHDLYFLARFHGVTGEKKRDTLDELLKASKSKALAAWLCRRPLLLEDSKRVIVHAGLHPRMQLDEASQRAEEIESILAGKESVSFLKDLFAERRDRWTPEAKRRERLLSALQVFTTIRTCKSGGKLCHRFTGKLSEMPDGCRPWFQLLPKKSAGRTIYFGHWAALGLYQEDPVVALDSGCVWGGSLSAVNPKDGSVYQQPNVEPRP